MAMDLSETIKEVQGSGFSLFFGTSSVLSLINSRENAHSLMKNAIEDDNFQFELQRQKELYEDEKEAQERAFKLWMIHRRREFARNEASKRLENDLHKADLQMFFNDWPLQISIEAINEKRKKKLSGAIPMSIIIAKHSMGNVKEPLSLYYSSIVDNVKSHLKQLGIIENNVYRFKDDNTIVGGPALANIYAMMNTLPTIMIIPKIDEKNKQFCVNTACWTQDSLFPMQNNVLSIDYDVCRINNDNSYLENKIEEISHAFVAISGVLNDTYSLVEERTHPTYPQYVKHCPNITNKYPKIIEYAKKEYQSLLDDKRTVIDYNGNNILVKDELFGKSSKNVVDKIIIEAIKSLK